MNWTYLWILLQTCGAGVVAGLTFVGLAPTKLGEKFLGHQLERRLAALKHEHDTQIESLKAQLARLGDRGVRSNEREYDATIAVWEAFVEAFDATTRCVVAFLRYPDFNRLPKEDINDYLNSTELSQMQKDEVLNADDKNVTYSRIENIRAIMKAGRSIFEARLLLRKQGPFVSESLSDKIASALDYCSEAQTEREMRFEHGPIIKPEKSMAYFKDNGQTFREVQAAVRKRLFQE